MKSEIAYNFSEVLQQFNIAGASKVLPFGSGNINSTFSIEEKGLGLPDYLLQRINHHVFRDIPLLMNNIIQVTGHLKKKMKNGKASEEVLSLVPANNKLFYYEDAEGNFWRVYKYIKGGKSFDLVETADQAFEAGSAFGRFQAMLADMDANLLGEIIPEFHNVESRVGKLISALKSDSMQRRQTCTGETSFLMERIERMRSILQLGRAGRLPLRITHNDTKFNNVLLDRYNKAKCVVDLDTVMPGYVAYDFGDATRTIINCAPEDEKDLSKIDINLALFRSFCEGYMRETIQFLTEAEIDSLVEGILLLPYLQAVRFLTDYLEGDVYFRIAFQDHNLQRTRAQLCLLHRLEENYSLLRQIIGEVAAAEKQSANTISV
jgi:Ser/Thr protein kinase RdoA (MazF antagonist)